MLRMTVRNKGEIARKGVIPCIFLCSLRQRLQKSLLAELQHAGSHVTLVIERRSLLNVASGASATPALFIGCLTHVSHRARCGYRRTRTRNLP